MVYQLPALCWAAAIVVASSMPQVPTPDMGPLTWDKTLHFGVFGILGFLALRAKPRPRGWATLASIGWAGLDEIHQAFVPGRDASPYDFLADVMGIGVAYLIFLGLMRRGMSPVWTGVVPERKQDDRSEDGG